MIPANEKDDLQEDALEDMIFFAKINLKLVKKIPELLNPIANNPFEGIGKPEPLKENLSGYRRRRINDKHRLIYEVRNDSVMIISYRSHYQ